MELELTRTPELPAVLLYILSVASGQPFQVDIATFGFTTKNVLASLPFAQPPIELAVEDVNSHYNGTLQFNVRFISEPSLLDCKVYSEEVSKLVAEWFYKERRPENEALSVVVSSGTDFSKWVLNTFGRGYAGNLKQPSGYAGNLNWFQATFKAMRVTLINFSVSYPRLCGLAFGGLGFQATIDVLFVLFRFGQTLMFY